MASRGWALTCVGVHVSICVCFCVMARYGAFSSISHMTSLPKACGTVDGGRKGIKTILSLCSSAPPLPAATCTTHTLSHTHEDAVTFINRVTTQTQSNHNVGALNRTPDQQWFRTTQLKETRSLGNRLVFCTRPTWPTMTCRSLYLSQGAVYCETKLTTLACHTAYYLALSCASFHITVIIYN